jgi:hypothetical protein
MFCLFLYSAIFINIFSLNHQMIYASASATKKSFQRIDENPKNASTISTHSDVEILFWTTDKNGLRVKRQEQENHQHDDDVKYWTATEKDDELTMKPFGTFFLTLKKYVIYF